MSSGGMAAALHVDVPIDLSVTAGAAAILVVTEAEKSALVPAQCRWCDVGGLDSRARDTFKWKDTKTPDAISYVTAYALTPIVAVGLDALSASNEHVFGETAEDALVVVESTLVATSVDQAAKFAFVRQRPYAHFDPPAQASADDNLSFFSGHTTTAFAAAVSAGTVASMRGRRLAPLVWGAGMFTAALSGYLRMAADKHYLTDVLTGAALGSGIGVLVPLVFHGDLPMLAVAPTPGGGAAVSWSKTF